MDLASLLPWTDCRHLVSLFHPSGETDRCWLLSKYSCSCPDTEALSPQITTHFSSGALTSANQDFFSDGANDTKKPPGSEFRETGTQARKGKIVPRHVGVPRTKA